MKNISKLVFMSTRRAVKTVKNTVEMVYGLSLRSANHDPGRTPFPKVIFELPSVGAPTPDGQSLAYLQLARSLWLRRWATGDSETEGRLGGALRVVHDAIQQAHVLERELLELSKSLK